jgi:hypothetical protein
VILAALDSTQIVVALITATAGIVGLVIAGKAKARSDREGMKVEKAVNVLDSWDDLVGRQNALIESLELRLRVRDEALDACSRTRLELRGEVMALEWELERYRRRDDPPNTEAVT